MRILVIGSTSSQLDNWRNKSFTQKAIHHRAAGTIVDGHNTYFLFVARRNDDRVRGMEFHKMILLEGAIDHGGQYSMRVRL